MKTVGDDADRPGRVAEHQLGERHGNVQEQYAEQHAEDRAVSVGRREA